MSASVNPYIPGGYSAGRAQSGLWTSFIRWCQAQQENRLLWMGVALGIHGCFLTPLTMMVVLLNGHGPAMFSLVILSMGGTLVPNLAALPTRITIPVFIFSVILDLILLVLAIFT